MSADQAVRLDFDEAECLAYDPFSGDRDCDVTEFADRFVTAAKAHRCLTCAGEITKGERHRAKTERDNDDGGVATFRFCRECCAAMAASWEDDGEAITARETLRIQRTDPNHMAISLDPWSGGEITVLRLDAQAKPYPPGPTLGGGSWV